MASSPVTSDANSRNGDGDLCSSRETSERLTLSGDLESSGNNSGDLSAEYVLLQLRIFRINLVVIAFAAVVSILFVDLNAAISLLLGACSGIIYLRLLAKNIGSLGKSSSSVGKVQLIVPAALVLVVAKVPDLHLLPSLVGFLLYKPSLIIQFLLEPYAQKNLAN